ncbi:hypothetical protein HK100_009136 [Physocladia obscura]|uniref:Uncharacterized protein n=1 Tax=Physocladia obscura TaxID=109957 RepID=A0AAD5XB74_9FUNG|nr:hypothetical protein HK100_009136 [Physocladia obscura]
MNNNLRGRLHVLVILAAVAAAVVSATTINFPSDVESVALTLAACFCTQYTGGGGTACATCINNAPSLTGKNSTVLFAEIAADCVSDNTGISAAVLIEPIIRSTVLEDVAVAVAESAVSTVTVDAALVGAIASTTASTSTSAAAALGSFASTSAPSFSSSSTSNIGGSVSDESVVSGGKPLVASLFATAVAVAGCLAFW